jgi:hypothetical protein
MSFDKSPGLILRASRREGGGRRESRTDFIETRQKEFDAKGKDEEKRERWRWLFFLRFLQRSGHRRGWSL